MGYFLNGLYITSWSPNYLSDIYYGHCCKPRNHPDGYGSCYTEDVGNSFEREGWTNCSKLGYSITGIYRGSGDKFRCCQMAAGKEITSKISYKDVTNNYYTKLSKISRSIWSAVVNCVVVIVANNHFVNFGTCVICIFWL